MSPAEFEVEPATSGWRGRAELRRHPKGAAIGSRRRCTDRSLPVVASPHGWLAERRGAPGRCALEEGLRRLAAARAGAVAGGSIEDSVLRVERTETAVPEPQNNSG